MPPTRESGLALPAVSVTSGGRTMLLSVPTQDVRHLLDLADPQHLEEPTDGMPESALSALMGLVPCDLVTYQVHDAAQHTFVGYRQSAFGLEPTLRRNPTRTCLGCVLVQLVQLPGPEW
jgi:hypothetical protein